MRFHHVCVAGLVALACGDPPAPEHTIHDGLITQDQTWRLADSPHLVRGWVIVENGATVTIEAGATVLFDTHGKVTFGAKGRTGRLLALGSATAPITMRGLVEGAAPGTWAGLRFRSNTASELRHVTVSGCGRVEPFDSIPPACLALGNPFLPDERPILLLDHVTVENGHGGAVALWGGSGFVEGSAVLTVRNMKGHIARMRAREVARFPLGGTFTGNDTNEVRLAGDTVGESITLVNEVPWTVEGAIRMEGPNAPVLTIPAGATIRLSGSLMIGANAPGGLQIGAEGGPTVNLLPRSTTWGSVDFRAHAVNSFIHDAVIESCGTTGGACVMMVGSFTGTGPAPAPVLRNVSIRHAAGGGLAMTYGGQPGPGSANLTIIGASGDAILVEYSPVGSIPPGQYTGNARDRIFINRHDVRQDETWHQRGIPYLIWEVISVEDTINNPTLTVEPGVTVTARGGIRVGYTAPGALRAEGTAAQPITFTGEMNIPGNWFGILIGQHAESSTTFDHVVVDYAGSSGGSWAVEGSMQFFTDIGPVVRNSTIRNSSSCGITIGNVPGWSTDFTASELGNTFTNNARGAVCGP